MKLCPSGRYDPTEEITFGRTLYSTSSYVKCGELIDPCLIPTQKHNHHTLMGKLLPKIPISFISSGMHVFWCIGPPTILRVR